MAIEKKKEKKLTKARMEVYKRKRKRENLQIWRGGQERNKRITGERNYRNKEKNTSRKV